MKNSQRALIGYSPYAKGINTKGALEYYRDPLWAYIRHIPLAQDHRYQLGKYLILLYYIETGKL